MGPRPALNKKRGEAGAVASDVFEERVEMVRLQHNTARDGLKSLGPERHRFAATRSSAGVASTALSKLRGIS